MTSETDLTTQSADIDVLFAVGCWPGESKRYRVDNVIEGLSALGYTTEIIDYGAIQTVLTRDRLPRVVVFFRAPYDPAVGIDRVMDHLRERGIRTVFDVDDYVFEPDIIGSIAGAAVLSPEQAVDYEWGVRAYRKLLLACDHVTLTNAYLVDRARALGAEASVVPNSVNAAQRRHVAGLPPRAPRDDDVVTLCYYSGSATHQRDFQVCAPAIRAVMAACPNVVFRLVGLLNLDDAWIDFAERIERRGFMSPLDMLANMRECDINLAPLEVGNPFCEGKSELKIFEPALLGLPCVASPIAAYAAVIDDGRSGMLAADHDAWVNKLTQLVQNKSLRESMGRAAHGMVDRHFSTDVAARCALAAYQLGPPTAAA